MAFTQNRVNAFFMPCEKNIKKENIASIRKDMLYLTDKRRDLVRKFYYEEMTMRQIASQTGVLHTAISQRMKTIRKHLQKQLRDCSI